MKYTHTDFPSLPQPQAADKSQFIDVANQRPLVAYYHQVFSQFAFANNFGLALDDEDSGAGTQKKVLLNDLFVPLNLTQQHISPDYLIEKEQQNKKALASFTIQQQLQQHQWLFILGDPGTGKSTLMSWLMLALTTSGQNHLKNALGKVVPFALILREMDLSQINSWDDLWQSFLDSRSATTQSLNENPALCKQLFACGQSLFLIDGLDEVSSPRTRDRLAQAVREGMARYPHSRFVITSRIMGFSQLEWFGLLPETKPQAASEDVLAVSEKSIEAENLLPINYLSPLNTHQQSLFVNNWYQQYVVDSSSHAQRIRDLLARLQRNDGLGQLARVPVLLNMICFIHARRNRLPDGRAELYQRIAETYLTALDQARGVQFKDRELGVDYLDLCEWLGNLAFTMQQRRGLQTQSEPEEKPEEKNEQQLLVPEQEIKQLLTAGLHEKGIDDSDVNAEVEHILDYIKQRSGLLVPRGIFNGEEHYSFSHLSFQEYFAAYHLSNLLQSPFMDEQDWQQLHDSKAQTVWHETLILLFEQITHSRMVDHLANKLFGALPPEEAELESWSLLCQIVMDSAIRFGKTERAKLVNQACKYSQKLSIREIFGNFKATNTIFNALWCHDFNARDTLLDLAKSSQRLTLSGNKINDISLLHKLTQLQTLNLSDTQVSELTPLRELTQLQTLNLSGTQVSNLTPLRELTQLQTLNLSGTQVSNLTPLRELTQLQTLNLSGTQVNNLTPLRELTQLQTLNLIEIQVSDLTPLRELTQLQILDLNHTQVSDLTPLRELTQLQILDLNHTQVNELTPLRELTQLQELDLSGTQVRNLTPLRELIHLQRLDLNQTQVSDLTPLRELTQLQILILNHTQVSDLTPLRELTQLRGLDLSQTQVSDLTPLRALTQLQILILNHTQVSDLTPLRKLTQLQWLYLSHTQVSDLTPLRKLTQLQWLYLSHTQVSDLTPLNGLAQLQLIT